MKLATTTADFGRFVSTHEECLDLIRATGFRCADFSLGGRRLFSDPNWREEAKKIRDHAERIGVELVQAHSPNDNVLRPERWERELFLGERSLELCEILGIPQVVMHAGYRKEATKEEWYEGNAKFYRALFPLMEQTGVTVLTENTTKANLGGYFFMFTGADMREFIEYVDHPLLQAVWDTGHGTTEGCQYENILALGKHLMGIHVHDNNGHADEHSLPYTGVLNMDALMNGLMDVGYKGCFTFEVVCGLRASKNRHTPRQSFEKDTRLLEPTLDMQIDFERLLYTIGKHTLQSYGVFEE